MVLFRPDVSHTNPTQLAKCEQKGIKVSELKRYMLDSIRKACHINILETAIGETWPYLKRQPLLIQYHRDHLALTALNKYPERTGAALSQSLTRV